VTHSATNEEVNMQDHTNYIGGQSLLSSGTLAAARQAHVESELQSLESLAGRLQGAFDNLASRIGPVLHIGPPSPPMPGAANVESVVAPLADRIRRVRRDLQQLEDQISTVLNSIEL
jgi:hypothetical protein